MRGNGPASAISQSHLPRHEPKVQVCKEKIEGKVINNEWI